MKECDGSGPGPPGGAGKGKGSFHAQQQPVNEYEAQMAADPNSQWPSAREFLTGPYNKPQDQAPQQSTPASHNNNNTPGFFSFVGDPLMEQDNEQGPQCEMCEDEPMELECH